MLSAVKDLYLSFLWITAVPARRLQFTMPTARTLAVLCSLLALTASAQTSASTADPVARVFHPTPPLPSYDVATIKPYDPTPMQGGMRVAANTTLRQYIRGAFAPAGLLSTSQVVGGPDWLDKDRFIIQGKPSPDLEVAMQKMTNDERTAQTRAMQQALLAERFNLRVHFEVREMPVYALVPAKGGIKIKPADAPTPSASSDSPSGSSKPPTQRLSLGMGAGGAMELRANNVSMAQFAGLIGPLINQTPGFISLANTGNRPVIDQTGFQGNFDLVGLKWAGPQSAAADTASTTSDLPALTTALEETLGIKLILTKGPVEVIVIDSIDHPSEN